MVGEIVKTDKGHSAFNGLYVFIKCCNNKRFHRQNHLKLISISAMLTTLLINIVLFCAVNASALFFHLKITQKIK